MADTPKMGPLRRLLLAIGGTVRLLTAGVVVYFLGLWVCASGPLVQALVAILCLGALLPPALLNRLRAPTASWTGARRWAFRATLGPKLWLHRRGFIVRWVGRALFCAAMAWLTLQPLERAPVHPSAQTLLSDPGLPAYDAVLAPDGGVIYVSHAHAERWGEGRNGVSRLDLDTGALLTREHDDEHGHYVEIFPEEELLVVSSYRRQPDDHPSGIEKIGHLYYLRPDTLELVAERSCVRDYPIRAYRLPDGDILQLAKIAGSLVRADDLMDPCGEGAVDIPLARVVTEVRDGDRRSYRPWVLGFEFLTFLPQDPGRVWATGEVGGHGCLVNLDTGRTERCTWLGPFVWSTAVDPDGDRLWVSRPAHHAVDIYDARTGAEVGRLAVSGVPRPIVFDPATNLAFVGMYFSGDVTIVDRDTLETLGRVGTGERLRKLLMNPSRDALVAVSAGTVLSYPLATLREVAGRPLPP